MTFDDVDRACAVLEQAGRTPSGNTVLAHLKARGLPASKRTVLKYLKLRQPTAGASVSQTQTPTTAPADPVAPAPTPVAPADAAQATWARFAAHRQQQEHTAAAPAPARDPVADAETRLVEARDDLLQLKGYYLCTREMPVDGLLHGSLHPHDPIHQQALADVDAAKREYDRCWAALAEAMVQRQQQVQQAQVARQETWVLAHRPELVTELRRAEETYAKVQALPDDAQKPKAHYAARFVLQQARAAYQQALALAPSTNGSTPEEG